MWRRPFRDDASRNKLLVADVRRAQTTSVQEMLFGECHTTLALVPPLTTSSVQPLDVSVNAEFKQSYRICACIAMSKYVLKEG